LAAGVASFCNSDFLLPRNGNEQISLSRSVPLNTDRPRFTPLVAVQNGAARALIPVEVRFFRPPA
jgi:hypothetical protein